VRVLPRKIRALPHTWAEMIRFRQLQGVERVVLRSRKSFTSIWSGLKNNHKNNFEGVEGDKKLVPWSWCKPQGLASHSLCFQEHSAFNNLRHLTQSILGNLLKLVAVSRQK
jgi:hypothetical protein